MARREAADPPARSNGRERLQDECAVRELGMRHDEGPRPELAAAPQEEVEVQDPRTPAATAPPAESALHVLEARQHRRGGQAAFDQRDGIGEVSPGATMRGVEDDRRGVEQAEVLVQPGDRGLDDTCRAAVAAVGAVRADSDGVEVGHGSALSLRAQRSNPAAQTGLLRRYAPRNDVAMAQPADLSPIPEAEAPRDCPLCPRLVAFRQECRAEHPDWWNAPVPAFGDRDAWLAIVGLAPGKHGANRTGRPFTGDYAGDLLYATLSKFGLAEGEYRADPHDGLQLNGAIIVNSVKCLPPANKPEPREIATCRHFLEEGLAALANLRVVIALGQIAHVAAARALGLPPASTKFGHGAEAVGPDGRVLLSSYHCSRYNQNTRRLDAAMFESVFQRALVLRD